MPPPTSWFTDGKITNPHPHPQSKFWISLIDNYLEPTVSMAHKKWEKVTQYSKRMSSKYNMSSAQEFPFLWMKKQQQQTDFEGFYRTNFHLSVPKAIVGLVGGGGLKAMLTTQWIVVVSYTGWWFELYNTRCTVIPTIQSLEHWPKTWIKARRTFENRIVLNEPL